MELNVQDLDWGAAVQILTLVLSLASGWGTVKIVQKLKMAFNLKSRLAQLLTIVVATLFSLSTLIVQGVVAPPDVVTVDYIIGVFAVVLTTSQAEYRRIQRAEEKQWIEND